jgi:hypothetical protein
LSTLTTKDVAVDKGKMLIFTPTLDAPTAAAIKVIYELQHWSSSPDDFADGLAENTQYVVSFAKNDTEGSTITLQNDDEVAGGDGDPAMFAQMKI